MTTEVFVLPASSAQQRLWFLDRLLQSGAAYNVCQAFRLHGPLDCKLLSAALDLVVARHESLRTSFRLVDGELRQIIHPGLTVPLLQLDHSALGAEGFEAALNADGARPFDLTAPPLLRATVFHVGPGAAVLLIVAHHVVVDGWSMALLLRELADGYHALAAGRQPLLPPLPVQYADFTLWEQKLLHGPDHPDVVFWRTRLRDVDVSLDLPSDRLRTTTRSFRGHLLTFRIDPALTDRLRALSLDGGGSIFIAALTAYAAVLHRSTGATTIMIGAPVANRPLPELEQVVGFFANTVVFRADLRGDPSLRDLMKRIRRDALDVYSHQSTPFDQIVRALGPRHTSERNPLFQVALAHQQQPDVLFSLPDIETIPLVVANGTAKFEMLVELQERSADVDCLLEMSDDLFTPAAAARFRDHFLHALTLLVDEPERRLSEMPLVSAGDQAIIDLTNATDADYPFDRTIAELFDEQARATPRRIAVVDGDDELTYEQLNRRADVLARRLIARGVGPEVAVGVALGRSIDLIVALLGILKAGGAYVPVDAAYPADRVAFMLADCEAALIVTAQAFAGQLPRDVPTIGLDDGPDVSSGQTSHQLAPAGPGDRLAYVMYTSGSTGRPKGVAIPNRGVVRLVRGSSYVDWDDVEAMLYVSSVAFDVSMFEIWGALLNGKRLVVVPERDFSLEQLARLLGRSKVDCVWLTAPLFNALVDYRTEALAGVRQLVVGGEALSVPHVRRALDRLPSTRIINGYGPTECSTFACCHSIPRTLPHDAVSVPIGVPIANTRAHVLDARLAELPVGAAGELCLGGDGLARDYLNDSAMTAERFVPVALGGRPDVRLYRTGDRVRRLADGTLDFLGRLDGQVKLRGFRIELGEIEAALGQLPSVADAVVAIRHDIPGDARLVAYVKWRSAGPEPVEALRAHLRRTLPDYMVPAVVVGVDTLPLTVSGKIDRAALPAPEAAAPIAPAEVGPVTATEQVIARIWAEVLGGGPADRHASFFEVGGHSLAALRLFAGIERAVGLSLPLSTLLQSPTIADLARTVDATLATATPARLSPVVTIKAGRTAPLVCVHCLSGDVVDYRDIAIHLSGEQQVLGLAAVIDEDIDARYGSLEATASAYVDELRRVVPRGPYYLCGWSSGGTLALEMAQQLVAAGDEVRFLGVIDAAPYNVNIPDYQSTVVRWARQAANVPRWLRDDLLTTSPAQMPSRARLAVRGLRRRLSRSAPTETVRDMVDFPQRSPKWERFAEMHFQAFRRYVPQPYAGRVSVFAAPTHPLLWLNDAAVAWKQIARDVDVYEVSGTHFSIVKEPHVQVLAQAITAAIGKMEPPA